MSVFFERSRSRQLDDLRFVKPYGALDQQALWLKVSRSSSTAICSMAYFRSRCLIGMMPPCCHDKPGFVGRSVSRGAGSRVEHSSPDFVDDNRGSASSG